jgi:hypothetical protein
MRQRAESAIWPSMGSRIRIGSRLRKQYYDMVV